MNLRYRDRFYIAEDISTEEQEKILLEFRNKCNALTRYEEIKLQEEKLVNERRGMLQRLREEFKSFIKEAHPEYLL